MGENLIHVRLAEIRARTDKASTAPWKVETSEKFGHDWPITTGTSSADGKVYHVCTDSIRASEVRGDAKTDAEFIAAARSDIPFLLDLVNGKQFDPTDEGTIKALLIRLGVCTWDQGDDGYGGEWVVNPDHVEMVKLFVQGKTNL